ncbi:MAG: ParA family protein [Acetivibrio ethanolgignens]
MSVIITVTNQKGGIGKTTTSSALISGLTAKNKKVLGVDLDPQGNLGFSLGIEIEDSPTIYDVFKEKVSVTRAISRTEYGDVIPSNILLSGAELEFNRPGREFLLRNALSDLQHLYDYIIIDTPPALNILTVNAYVASNCLIIPMVPEILSLLGVSQLKETIDTVVKFYNKNLNVLGILLTKYNKHLNLSKEVLEMAETIATQLNTRVFDAKIRQSVAVAEAPAHCQSILDYAPKSKPALDYHAFIDEVFTLTQEKN